MDRELSFEHDLRNIINTYAERGRVVREANGRSYGEVEIKFNAADGGSWEVSTYDRTHIVGTGAELSRAYMMWEQMYNLAQRNKTLRTMITHEQIADDVGPY